MLMLLAQDLMMSAEARNAAASLGLELKTIGSLDRLTTLMAETPPAWLVVDLQLAGLDMNQLATLLDSLDPDCRPGTLGYAQHVRTDLLTQARKLGLDNVITRGQAMGGLAEFFQPPNSSSP